MRLEINLRATPEMDLPRLEREWYEGVTVDVFSQLFSELVRGPVLSIPGKLERLEGDPGGAWASLTLSEPFGGRRAFHRAWSSRTWQAFLLKLGRRSVDSEFWAVELDATGHRYEGDLARASIESVSNDNDWRRFTLEYGGPGSTPKGMIASVDIGDVIVCLWDLAQRLPITFGCITDDGGHGGETMLEDRLGRSVLQGVQESESVLRGYPWLTICSSTIAHRLGGVSQLRKSGAFCEVEELPTGSVWLKATPSLANYSGQALDVVFRAVASVLPPGRPRPYVGRKLGRLIYEDARSAASDL